MPRRCLSGGGSALRHGVPGHTDRGESLLRIPVSICHACGRRGGTFGGVQQAAGRQIPEPLRIIVRCAVVAAAYFVAAKLGLRLAFSNQNVTSVWPPTGIAVAALLLLGPRVWPGIAVGALLANLSNGASFPTSAGITMGNTLAPILSAALLNAVGFRAALDRVRDVVALVLLGGVASMLVSATGGTTALAATGQLGRSGYGSTWLVWWVGDALGVVIFAPVILTCLSPDTDLSVFRKRVPETIVVFGGAAVLAALVFQTNVPLAHLLFPFAIWAALRFYAPGAAALTVIVSIIAILETAEHLGPFTMLSPTTNLVSLQAFNAAMAITAMSLAAVTLERRAAQVSLEEERETARRLRVLDEFKDSLLTAVSHELRTPLTVIIGLTSTMRNAELDLTPGDQRELVRRLEANAKRLDRLLMDLLDVDRLNRRVIEPSPRATGLRDVVLRVLDTMQVEGHPVSVDVGDEEVSVDPAHLERIVENLVSNAAKHTPVQSRIWVRAEERADWVTLFIDDEGPGVPRELRQEVFEPFRRGDPNSHAPGTGVGLSLVARFAALNGGSAWVEEREGGGASFRVRLPAVSASTVVTAATPRQ